MGRFAALWKLVGQYFITLFRLPIEFLLCFSYLRFILYHLEDAARPEPCCAKRCGSFKLSIS